MFQDSKPRIGWNLDLILFKMSLEKPKARDEKWPAAGLDKSRVFFDDISETVRTIENNSKRMFVASDIIGVEACAIAKFGASTEGFTEMNTKR